MATRASSPGPEERPAKKAKTDELLPGTVTTFHATRGFGFITPDNGQSDVFVHQSAIFANDDGYRYLTVGQKVMYVAEMNEGKFKATKVTGPDGVALKTKADPRAKKAGKDGKKGGKTEKKTEAVEAKQEPDSPELRAKILYQIEYYLGDKNLERDMWMRKLILASGPKSAVSLEDLLKCNKLKALTTDVALISAVVATSSLVHMTKLGDKVAVGLGSSEASVRPLVAFASPVAALLLNVAKDKTWKELRAGYLASFQAPVSVYPTAAVPFLVVDAEHKATIALAIQQGIKDIDGKAIAGVAEAAADQQAEFLKQHYEAINKSAEAKKENLAGKKRGREESKKGGHGGKAGRTDSGPVYVGETKFASSQEVFDKIKSIMAEYKNAAPLLGADRQFMLQVFRRHPRGAEKLKYLRQIVVKDNEAFEGGSQCFFLQKKDGVEEDISYVKCVHNLSNTPEVVAPEE